MFGIVSSSFYKKFERIQIIRRGERLWESNIISRDDWVGEEEERERERERDFSGSRSQLLFVFLLDKFRAARRMSENTNDYSDDTVYLKVSYFKAPGLYFFMKGLRWFMLWPRLFGKSPRALRCDFPGGNWQGTGVCREGNPGSKEGLRENEQTSIFAYLVLVILVYLFSESFPYRSPVFREMLFPSEERLYEVNRKY